MRLTWISGGNDTGVGEITVEIMAAIGLVVGIHGVGGKCLHVVGGIAYSTRLNRFTINSLAADIVYVCL